MLFTVTRTEMREEKFKWVGPVAISRLVFFARKDSKIKINSLAEAKKVPLIGTVRNYSAEKYLLTQGFQNIQSVIGSEKLNPQKLIKGRIDLWATVDLVGIHFARLQGVNPENMKVVYVIKEQPKYLAFSKQVPDEIVQAWQAALDSMKQDGTFDNYFDKWIR